MQNRLWMVLFAVACTRENKAVRPEEGESCSTPQLCAEGSYALCRKDSACRYLTSDGSNFTCPSCDQCGSALSLASSWCLSMSGSLNGAPTSGANGGTSGGGTTGGVNGGTSGGGTSGGAGTCDSCQNQVLAFGGACESQLNACTADARCAALIDCIDNCGDSSCDQTCANNAGSPAVSRFNAIVDCICNNCSLSCSAECGSSGGTTSGGTSGGGSSGGVIGGLAGGLTGGSTGGSLCGLLPCSNDGNCTPNGCSRCNTSTGKCE